MFLLPSLFILSCQPPDTRPLTAVERSPATIAKLEALENEVSTYEGTVTRLQTEVDSLLAENAALKLRAEQAELIQPASAIPGSGDSARAGDEARRYKEGLERCVATLNQQKGSRTVARSQPRQPSSSAVFPRQPQAIVSGTSVIVEGNVHNAGSEVAAGYLEVVLFVNENRQASKTLTLELPARAVQDYTITFTSAIGGSMMTARATAEWGDHNP